VAPEQPDPVVPTDVVVV